MNGTSSRYKYLKILNKEKANTSPHGYTVIIQVDQIDSNFNDKVFITKVTLNHKI